MAIIMITLTRTKAGAKYDNHYGIFGSLILPNAENGSKDVYVTHEKPIIYYKNFLPYPAPYDSCVPEGLYAINYEEFNMYPTGVYCISNPNGGVFLHKSDIQDPADQYGAIFTNKDPRGLAGPAICLGLGIAKKDNNRVVSETNQALDRFIRYLDTHPNERFLTIKWA